MKEVTWKNKRLRVSGNVRPFQSGCGFGVIERPEVREVLGDLRDAPLAREELIEFVNSGQFLSAIGEITAFDPRCAVWALVKARRPESSYFETSNYVHDALLSGECGAVIAAPPVANVFHGEDIYQSAITCYFWIPPANSYAIMKDEGFSVVAPFYKETHKDKREASSERRAWLRGFL